MSRQTLHPRTVIINKVQKNKSKIAKKEALNWLIEKFPAAFNTDKTIQPLKIGIIDDIFKYTDEALELGISRSKLREALVLFTRRIDYLICLKARERRIDLLGAPGEFVSEEEAHIAAQKIKKRIEKSARNAKSLIVSNASTGISHQPNKKDQPLNYDDFDNHESSSTITKKEPIIKHKNNRTFDPQAVARLKEKLGLARKMETTD